MQWMNTPVTKEALQWVGAIADRRPALGLIMNQMDSESEEFIIYQNILELERTYMSKIILAETAEAAEAAYNEMVSIADSMGGKDLVDWANKLYPDLAAAYEEIRSIGEEGWERK